MESTFYFAEHSICASNLQVICTLRKMYLQLNKKHFFQKIKKKKKNLKFCSIGFGNNNF